MIQFYIISADGSSPKEFLSFLKQNNCREELNAHYHESFICRYVVPYTVERKDIAGLAKLYSWSYHESVKSQALQNLKALLHDPSVWRMKLWKHLVNMERILRPKQEDPKMKDKNIVMLCLEVYRLIISLLYIAIVSGNLGRDDVADILEHRKETHCVLEALAEELYLLNFDRDQVKSHMYIIAKFLTDKLHTAVDMNKSQKVSVMVKQLNHLTEANLTAEDQKSSVNDIQSSMGCLSDKFHQHVIFHYLVILVSSD